MIFRAKYIHIFLAGIVLQFLTGGNTFAQSTIELTQSMLNNNDEIIFSEGWRGTSGDNFRWIEGDYIFEDWEEVSSLLDSTSLEVLEWEGYGWFKLNVKVDSALVNKPLLLHFKEHNGASQVYLNDELQFRIGTFSILEGDHISSKAANSFIVQFRDTSIHVLSLRYSNHRVEDFIKYGISPGFMLAVSSAERNALISNRPASDYSYLILLGLLGALTLVHFMFLIFYPAGEKNLYFVLFAGGITLFVLFSNIHVFSDSPDLVVTVQKWGYVSWLAALIGLLKFSYSFLKNSTPVQLSLFLIIGILILIGWFSEWLLLNQLFALFSLLILIEVARIYTILQFKLKEHVGILIWGFVIYIVWIIYSTKYFSDFYWEKFALFDNLWATSFFVFSVSAYLLKDFAKAQTKLEYKYLEVKHLSERSIEQERRSKAKEIEQKILERENQRKTAELEEARALQISMLPTKIPDTEFWDIAAFMEPSQEVGGDYYDFSLSKRGELTVALGDATGHGMKAGIVVATAKSYFHSLVNDHNNVEIIKKMSSGIKNMNIKMMYMGLMLLRCKENHIKFSSAGMPPSLIYRAETGTVEEVLQKAMPLGSSPHFPYIETEHKLQSGDVFLLFSDGLMELFNEKREQLGVEMIGEKLKGISGNSAEEILNELKNFRDEWLGKARQEDDVTIVVMKAK